MAVRTLSGVVLVAAVAAAVLFSPYTFALLVAVICVGTMREFYRLAEAKNYSPLKWYGIALGLILLAANFFLAARCRECPSAGYLFTLLMLLAFTLFFVELYRQKGDPIANIGATLLGVIYIALPLSLFFHIAAAGIAGTACTTGCTYTIAYNPAVVLAYFAMIWMNDIGAYVVGISIGRHRLFERISPKKSWEGFFGGLVFGTATGVLAGHLLGANLLFWAGFAVVASLGGVAGDLVESMFKRSAGTKDSGSMIPGHGGFLDRFDALVFSLPFVFIYFITFA